MRINKYNKEVKKIETETEKTETETTPEENWMEKELEVLNENSQFDGERKPALQLEENKPVKMVIDFSEPFKKWTDSENDTVKKIVPVHVGAVDLVWWLNVKNPIYQQIIDKGSKGQVNFTVLQTGNKKTTKYILVEEAEESTDTED